jgi:hypothetical protein
VPLVDDTGDERNTQRSEQLLRDPSRSIEHLAAVPPMASPTMRTRIAWRLRERPIASRLCSAL